MRTIAAIGNVKKQSTFSGTPYHFFKTSLKEGLVQDGWALPMKRHFFYRFMYNIRKVLTFQRPGGYQYSSLFCKVAYKSVPQYFWSSEVISFNQHFPTALFIHNKGGKIYYYIDATFTQLIERYGFK